MTSQQVSESQTAISKAEIVAAAHRGKLMWLVMERLHNEWHKVLYYEDYEEALADAKRRVESMVLLAVYEQK